jgi:hypothetical protein
LGNRSAWYDARMTVVLAGLLVATSVHLGFQLTVTFVVYPALVRAPDWAPAHLGHTRAITPLVVLVYGLLVVASLAAAVLTWFDAWVLLSVAGAALAGLTTAFVAGPTHGRLAAGRDPVLVARLLTADRLRTLGAAVAVAGALGAVLGR